MAVGYTNRKGMPHFLHMGMTKTGKTRYFMASSIRAGAMKSLPEGYEIAEDVNRVVSVRKAKANLIPSSDLDLVSELIQSFSHLRNSRVTSKHDTITVYAPLGFAEGMTSVHGNKDTIFEEVMRFVFDPEDGVYFVDRKHYHGDGGWHPLEMRSTLAGMCETVPPENTDLIGFASNCSTV